MAKTGPRDLLAKIQVKVRKITEACKLFDLRLDGSPDYRQTPVHSRQASPTNNTPSNKMVKITVSHFQQRARLGLAESDFLPDLFSVLLRKKDDGSQNKMVKLTVSHF
ncbi:MAG TPA: hypothetical protein VMG34_03240, partial [Bacteroidota bacterium]|nr:hypothetical protein [Bacteroidota bacterium]